MGAVAKELQVATKPSNVVAGGNSKKKTKKAAKIGLNRPGQIVEKKCEAIVPESKNAARKRRKRLSKSIGTENPTASGVIKEEQLPTKEQKVTESVDVKQDITSSGQVQNNSTSPRKTRKRKSKSVDAKQPSEQVVPEKNPKKAKINKVPEASESPKLEQVSSPGESKSPKRKRKGRGSPLVANKVSVTPSADTAPKAKSPKKKKKKGKAPLGNPGQETASIPLNTSSSEAVKSPKKKKKRKSKSSPPAEENVDKPAVENVTKVAVDNPAGKSPKKKKKGKVSLGSEGKETGIKQQTVVVNKAKKSKSPKKKKSKSNKPAAIGI